MNPKPISSLEIWYLGNGQGHAVALDAHLDLGANQVEGGIIRRGRGDGDQEQQQAKYGRSHFMAAEQFYEFRETHCFPLQVGVLSLILAVFVF